MVWELLIYKEVKWICFFKSYKWQYYYLGCVHPPHTLRVSPLPQVCTTPQLYGELYNYPVKIELITKHDRYSWIISIAMGKRNRAKLTLVVTSTFSPFCSNVLIMPTWPYLAAVCMLWAPSWKLLFSQLMNKRNGNRQENIAKSYL